MYNAVKKYDYDPVGNVVREQAQNNVPSVAESFTKTEYTYNSRGFLTAADSYDGAGVANRVEYAYDAAGNMTAQMTGCTGAPATTRYEYDRFGNMTKLTDALGQAEIYAYDLLGNVTAKTDRNGAVTEYAYDGLGRLLDTTVTTDGKLTGRTAIIYTLTGQNKRLSNNEHTTEYTYDPLGRLVEESETGGVMKNYTYDIGGNRTRFGLTVSGITQLDNTYEYDELSRLTKVYESGVLQAAYTYDRNGNRATLTLANGVVTTYTYNLANLVTGLVNKQGNTVQSSYVYTYYLDGNQRSKNDHERRTTVYTYDGLGRLTRETESGAADAKTYAYVYDSRSNRASLTVTGAENYVTTYEYDQNDRLLQTVKTVDQTNEITTYQYDPNGNTLSTMTEKLAPLGTESAALSLGYDGGYELNAYNGFNQLISSNVGGVETTYTYKPNGLRLSKSTNGAAVKHVWDGQNIALELNGSGVVLAKYVRGINLISSTAGGTASYYSFNAHGDVVQLTNASGAVTKNYRYDAFGVEQKPNENDTNPWRYCGEYWDSSSGTYYLRARYYDPLIGRMISADTHWNPSNMIYGDNPVKWNERKADPNDPLGLNTYTYVPDITAIMQSGNLYAYCMNNPLMFQDPGGESIILTCIIVGAIIGAIGGGAYGAYKSNQKLGYVNGWWVLGGAAGGAALGGLAGWGVGAAATAIGATLAAGSGGTLGTVVLSRWQDAEQAVRNAYNAVKYTFDIPGMASRMVDGFNKAKGVIYEVKYGAASLSQFIQSEIVRDVWIRNNVQGVNAIEWHFYVSQATGQGGPSGPLLAELAKYGIKVVFH